MLRGDAERHMGLANRAYLQGDLVSAKFYAYNVLALGTRTLYSTILYNRNSHSICVVFS